MSEGIRTTLVYSSSSSLSSSSLSSSLLSSSSLSSSSWSSSPGQPTTHVRGFIFAKEPSGHTYANSLFLHTHDVSQVSGSRYGFLFSSLHLNSQFVGHSHVP